MTIQRDIRLLAKEPKLKAKLGAPRNRDPIPGKVTPFTDDTFATASTAPAADSGSGGECNTNPNDTEQQENDQVSDPNDPNSFYKGGAGSTSTGSTDSTTETGVQDIDSVMDGDTSGGGSDSYSTDPEPAIKGLTNLTDKDGNCFTVRMDGTFPVPDGWEDADTPPETPGEANSACPGSEAPPSGLGYKATSFTTLQDQDANEVPPPIYFRSLADLISQTAGLFAPTKNSFLVEPYVWGNCTTVSAGTSPPNGTVSFTFQSDQPIPEDYYTNCWPSSDGCYTLSAIDGTFQTNQYDCNAPDNWEPKSTIYSYENGVPKYAVTGTATGGHMIYDTNPDGTPNSSGMAKVYGPNGNLVAAGDATSQFMDQYLPK